METKKVRICPFCGHHGHKLLYSTVKVRYEDGDTEVRDIWQMECWCCGARGPTEYSPEIAVDSWNILYGKPAHGDDSVEEDFTFDEETIKNTRKETTNGKEQQP